MTARNFLLGTAAVAVSAIITFSMNNGSKKEPRAKSPEQKNGYVSEGGVLTEAFVVRMEGRTVNVYSLTDSKEVYYKTVEGVNTFDLPSDTAQQLEKGINIASRQELERLIEEITS